MSQVPLKLAAARFKVMDKRPYFAPAVIALVPVAKAIGTFATDRWWRLYYDPKVVEEWSVEEIMAVVLHEIGHLLRDHFGRAQYLGVNDFVHSELANIAGDCEINDDLVAEGFSLPGSPAMPADLNMANGLMFEEYYAALLRQNPDLDKLPNTAPNGAPNTTPTPGKAAKGQQGQQGQQGQGGKPGRLTAPAKAATGGGPPGALPEHLPNGQVGAGRCGSAAAGVAMPWEDAPPEHLGGDKGAPYGIGEMEGELVRREVARRILDSSNSRGTSPGGWRRWAEEKLTPKVNWRRRLASLVRMAVADTVGQVDYSYRRPSRRQSAYGRVIQPSLRQPLPIITCVVDTSGSMGEYRLTVAMSEFYGLLKQLGLREGVSFLSVDAAVHLVKRVFSVRDVELLGGGGTDMRVGIERAARQRPKPHIVIVFTDGETPWPEHAPPGVRVIVLLVGEGTVPPWATCIKVDQVVKTRPAH